ncbi:MAG: PhnD/SsuA/transferrin family substrate-binding protein [Planctomycetota bacterium]
MSHLVALLLAGFSALPVTKSPVEDQKPLSLAFGVYQSDKATVMYRSFTPVLEALMVSMEERLGRSVDINLTIFRSYEDGIDSLARGEVDFVRFGPASYITAVAKQPDLQLIAMETESGDKRFKGLIVVQKESPIRKIGDLRGKSFAFGDPNSTIGRYLVQAQLVENGITGRDLSEYRYLGRHDTVVKAVEIGDFDAGSVMQQTFEKANAKGTLRVLASFENVTKPWVARKGLDRPTLEAIQASLYALKDPAVLKELKISGFVPTSDEEYRLVREGMKLAEAFEIPRGGN